MVMLSILVALSAGASGPSASFPPEAPKNVVQWRAKTVFPKSFELGGGLRQSAFRFKRNDNGFIHDLNYLAPAITLSRAGWLAQFSYIEQGRSIWNGLPSAVFTTRGETGGDIRVFRLGTSTEYFQMEIPIVAALDMAYVTSLDDSDVLVSDLLLLGLGAGPGLGLSSWLGRDHRLGLSIEALYLGGISINVASAETDPRATSWLLGRASVVYQPGDGVALRLSYEISEMRQSQPGDAADEAALGVLDRAKHEVTRRRQLVSFGLQL